MMIDSVVSTAFISLVIEKQIAKKFLIKSSEGYTNKQKSPLLSK